ncbi:hypothetical protein P7K49_030959 [Saguinus oedipus]|uniref:Uncharacterized protein n=1 Tax=Saguinus oedipus TaxID=9490 RepID=A0ABQ9U4I6_SAGOE|nr:hypothetical protein P7K49_030959 [Saguinus oedipus]
MGYWELHTRMTTLEVACTFRRFDFSSCGMDQLLKLQTQQTQDLPQLSTLLLLMKIAAAGGAYLPGMLNLHFWDKQLTQSTPLASTPWRLSPETSADHRLEPRPRSTAARFRVKAWDGAPVVSCRHLNRGRQRLGSPKTSYESFSTLLTNLNHSREFTGKKRSRKTKWVSHKKEQSYPDGMAWGPLGGWRGGGEARA